MNIDGRIGPSVMFNLSNFIKTGAVPVGCELQPVVFRVKVTRLPSTPQGSPTPAAEVAIA